MRKCPYCAEEIQDEAILCRYCGKDVQNSERVTRKPQRTLLKFLLHPIFIIFVGLYIATQSNYKLSSFGASLYCVFWVIIVFIASTARDKLMTDDEKQREKENAEYWEGRGR